MSESRTGAFPSGRQAGTTDAGWAPPRYGVPVEPRTRGLRTWLSIGGSVAAVGLIGAGALGLGFGDPEVGDCVRLTSDTGFEVVDCSAGAAEYRIVGLAAEDITYPDYMADDDLCSAVADTEVVLWSGADPDPGTAYCAAGL